MSKTFSIYRSSAGSGKTRTLAKAYLKLALQFRSGYFRHILAVTFTNKASQEMKDRILAYVDDFANGRYSDLAGELMKELGLSEPDFRQRAHELRSTILHHYDEFSVSTIDAFFQRVIRSFTRESGILGDYRLEVEQDVILEDVINNLIDELGNNRELTEWVVAFATDNLRNERAWDVRYSLIEFAREIFREDFRQVESAVADVTAQPRYFQELKDRCRKIKSDFISRISAPAREAIAIIERNQWTADDFHYGKGSGLLTFLKAFANERNPGKLKVGDRVRSYFAVTGEWSRNSPRAQVINQAAATTLGPLLNQALAAYDQHYQEVMSAEVVLKNLYVFGLITDISRKLKEYKDENNTMLLADAPKFLHGIIQDSDTPFIYEKVGSFYKNYLIDEFQDTSGMQWKNFQPLIVNSLDSGHASLVVGDVKQAIYRWRGGDLDLLQKQVPDMIGADRLDVHNLDRNFRSAPAVVGFNNAFFGTAPALLSNLLGTPFSDSIYKDAAQQPARESGGFVHVRFFGKLESSQQLLPPVSDAEGGWMQRALENLATSLEKLQRLGAPLRDIAILVRKNEEGQRVAAWLLEYKNSAEAQSDCRYDVVSNESLRIDGAASVNLLLGAMRYLMNPEDAIARAQLGFEYARLHEPGRILSDVFAVSNQLTFENNLPPAFTREKPFLKKLALVELTETLIRIFKLESIQGEFVYLQAFQDVVMEFFNRERNDLGAFLEWWDEIKHKKSIQLPGNVDAVQVLTIHKSKGLQFPYVIIPFCSWGLDHDNWQAPNLWVRSESGIFADAGYLPVRYGKSLEDTCFREAYREERRRIFMDNLNLLYVAFTRAEKGLIITAPLPETKNLKETAAGLVYDTIERDEKLKPMMEASGIFSTGEWVVSTDHAAEPLASIGMETYRASDWREKLVIKSANRELFDVAQLERRDKINRGIFMHGLLAGIHTQADTQGAIDRLRASGSLGDEEVSRVADALTELLAIPQVADWFSPSWTIRTETSLLLPGGETQRIDRLLTRDDHAVIIDFKSGAPAKADQSQMLGYMEAMRQMNFTKIEAYLVYLAEKNIVEVKKEGKPKIIKKQAARDQLSLGF